MASVTSVFHWKKRSLLGCVSTPSTLPWFRPVSAKIGQAVKVSVESNVEEEGSGTTVVAGSVTLVTSVTTFVTVTKTGDFRVNVSVLVVSITVISVIVFTLVGPASVM